MNLTPEEKATLADFVTWQKHMPPIEIVEENNAWYRIDPVEARVIDSVRKIIERILE